MRRLRDRIYFSVGIYVVAAVSLSVYAVWCGILAAKARITGESLDDPWALDYDD